MERPRSISVRRTGHDRFRWRKKTVHGISILLQANKKFFTEESAKMNLPSFRCATNWLTRKKEYSSQPHDGGSGHPYAQKFFSDPGKQNGLYWPVSSGESESPIGSLVASAAVEGYAKDSGQQRQPFQGYYFLVF